MRQTINALIILSLLLSGCSAAPANTTVTNQEPAANPQPSAFTPSIEETIALCDELCGTDRDAYCAQERTIRIDGKNVTGTCRAFSQSDHTTLFNKCEGYCKPYPKSTTYCSTDGKIDVDCDGEA